MGLVIQPPQDLATLRLHDSSLEANDVGAGPQSAVQTAEGQVECGYSAGSTCSCAPLCSHCRVQSVWSDRHRCGYRRPPGIWYGLRRRQESISEEVKEIAWKAQHRLHKRYMKLGAAGKDQKKIVTAVARELLGFIWAIGTKAEMVASQGVAA